MSLLDDLLELERGFWAAAGDADYYRDHMADGGRIVLPFHGGILGKPQTMEVVDASDQWASFELDDVRLTELTSDCVALVYLGTGARLGAPRYWAAISSVYVRQDDAWRLALHQQTPLEG
ncbi:MAG: DUF4440 domain-containing protein [Dehalococcoidia bacterium]|nr:DUF4440 domain-containing protein [Dehalococcoidia bacterium]